MVDCSAMLHYSLTQPRTLKYGIIAEFYILINDVSSNLLLSYGSKKFTDVSNEIFKLHTNNSCESKITFKSLGMPVI